MDESITKTTKFEEQSSWGDTIRAYEASKKNLHWDVNDESAKVKRINLRERRCQERELDPVLMKYRDDDKEQNYMMKKASKSQLVLDRVATASATRFNIINHNGPSKNNGPYNQSEKSAKSLHLISNLLGKDHKEAPILYDEKFYSQRFVSKTEKIAKRVNSREFNIVSNNYYRNHNERIQEEFEKLQSEVTKKYWETHGYNPVIAQYYSDADEERYNAKLKEVEAMQGKSQACRLPPGVFYSEGKAYNIINHKMLDEDRLATATASKTRALNKSKKLQATEKLIRETASKDAELKELRRLNRIRFDKWQEGIDRGYNPIDLSVVDVTNPTTALRIFPAPKRPATVWDKLQAPVGYGSRPVTSVSARDISNGSQSKQNEIPASPIAASARSSRSVLSSARSNPVEMGGSSSRRSVTANALPQLNLNKVEPPPAVTYSDSNVNGPPGQPIAMVRTGGFSGLK